MSDLFSRSELPHDRQRMLESVVCGAGSGFAPGRPTRAGHTSVHFHYKDRSNSGQSRFRAESAPPERQASRPQPPAPHEATRRVARHPLSHRQRRPQEPHRRPSADHFDGRQDGLQGPDPPQYGRSLQVPPRGPRCQADRSRLNVSTSQARQSSATSRSSNTRVSPPELFMSRSVRNTASIAGRTRRASIVASFSRTK
jgi:hypothetical protein